MIEADTDIAGRLFGTTTPSGEASSAATAPAAAPVKASPAVFIPAEVAAFREAAATAADVMFADTPADLGDPATVNALLLVDRPTATSAELAEGRAEIGRMLTGDLMLMREDALEVLAVAREVGSYTNTEKTRGMWRRQAETALRNKFGADAPQVVADARALVQRDPRLVKMLDRNGLGDHPQIIMKLAEGARRARMAGRFEK